MTSNEKRACSRDGVADRGYGVVGSETLDPQRQVRGDTKESFSIGDDALCESNKPFFRENIWPSSKQIPDFRSTMVQYHSLLTALGHRMLHLIALSLDLPRTFFDSNFTRPVTLMRLLHYSAEKSRPSDGIYGAGAHTDYGMITLLTTDGTPGLQLFDRNSSTWFTVDTGGINTIVVNIGDMLQRWTNDRYTSTLHRVINTTGAERYSIPFFFEPNFDTPVACLPSCCSSQTPPKYDPISSGQYLMDKYAATYKK